MSIIQSTLEYQDILLTIFEIIEQDGRPLPLTREEVLSLIMQCQRQEDALCVFSHWRKTGLLRERRGRFYVLRETALAFRAMGMKPALDRHSRRDWIINNPSLECW